MFCTNCGVENHSDNTFCKNCGVPLEVKTPDSKIPPIILKQGNVNKSKKVLGGIGSVVVFIIAYTIVRALIGSGGSPANIEIAKSNVTNYFSDNGQWKDFNSVDGHFAASFPIYPTKEDDSAQYAAGGKILKFVNYSAEGSTYYYIIAVGEYSQSVDVSNPKQNLEGSLNGIVASTAGNKVISSNYATFDNYQAMNFEIQNSANNAFLKGRLILAGSRLYEIEAAYSDSKTYSETDYNKFLNSFTITQ